MTDEQPPQDPTIGASGDVPPPPPVTPPVEGAGWVQPPPVAAPPPVEGSGWVQPAQPPAAAPGPAWGQPPAAPPVAGSGWVQPTPPPAAAPPPVEGSGWVQPTPPPAAAAGPTWGQPPAQAAPPAGWAQPPAGPPPAPAPGGWAQPQPTPGWVQPVTGQQGPVTILARIAGLFLVLIGLFWGAIGVVLIIGGSAFKSIIDQFGPISANGTDVDTAGNIVGGVFVGIGIVILVLAIVEVLGGFGTLIGKTWGRILGILYSLVFGAFLLVAVAGGTHSADVGDTSGATGGLIFVLVMFLLYLYSLVVLLLRWRGHARA